MQELYIKAHAKINLFLDVLSKRPDGYHEIETVFQSIRLHDDVILRKRPCGITVQCEHPQVPSDASNLVYRAAKLLLEISGCPGGIDIVLHKRIPVAAGLGGGSADAAATLVGLNHLYKLGYERKALMQLGAKLGADIPFCILGGTALGCGIGEILTPLPPLECVWLVVANPGFLVSTAWVYRQKNFWLTKSQKNVTILISEIRRQKICDGMFNALENVVIAVYPIIAELKNQLKNAGGLATLMSGSGPTVFAVMQDELHARSVAEEFSSRVHFCTAMTTSPVGVTIV